MAVIYIADYVDENDEIFSVFSKLYPKLKPYAVVDDDGVKNLDVKLFKFERGAWKAVLERAGYGTYFFSARVLSSVFYVLRFALCSCHAVISQLAAAEELFDFLLHSCKIIPRTDNQTSVRRKEVHDAPRLFARSGTLLRSDFDIINVCAKQS